MAERTVIDCDKCGVECKEHIKIAIPNGISHEYGGHKTETYYDFETKHLCVKCAENLLSLMLGAKRVVKGETIDWTYHRSIHPNSSNNDSVGISLRFFNIKEKK